MKLIYAYSFLSVYRDKRWVHIGYAGNMGASIDRNVRPPFDKRFGKGSFSKLQKVAEKEDGWPDYMYELLVSRANFDKICGG